MDGRAPGAPPRLGPYFTSRTVYGNETWAVLRAIWSVALNSMVNLPGRLSGSRNGNCKNGMPSGTFSLITPLNDSFIDFDLLGDIDPDEPERVRPSVYSEMVWGSRKLKARQERVPIDWIVMRNRTSASRIEAKNKQRVGDALKTLSSRIGFRLAPGLSERVIFRELFPQGLTLLDLDSDAVKGEMKMTHLAARQELRDLFLTLKLPGLEGEPLKF